MTGPQGQRGEAGPAGKDGAKGDKGDAGPRGLTGKTGPAGSDGKTPNFEIRDGHLFAIYEQEVHMAEAREIDLGLVKGPKGDKGDTGPRGPEGPELSLIHIQMCIRDRSESEFYPGIKWWRR